VKINALRLVPGSDLRIYLRDWAIAEQLQAGFMLSAIGSLSQASIRFADQTESQILLEPLEILSLAGTISLYGMHLHILVADDKGRCYGGHLQPGCLIRTTAEVVIGSTPDLIFRRAIAAETGFLELEIEEKLHKFEQ
jgi:uncharacterized protein